MVNKKRCEFGQSSSEEKGASLDKKGARLGNKKGASLGNRVQSKKGARLVKFAAKLDNNLKNKKCGTRRLRSGNIIKRRV